MTERHENQQRSEQVMAPSSLANGSSSAFIQKQQIEWTGIPNRRPEKHAFTERFNHTYRDEILDANLFFNVTDAWGESESFHRRV